MDDISKKLPQVKRIELEILSVVHDFCEKNNLKYTLAYGTLLGAVRHKGFIPWDDDIDIWMPREDYETFIKLWLSNPIDGYVIQNPYIETDFTQNFTKIRKDNTTYLESEEEKKYKFHKGIFIDIFPLDNVADNGFKNKRQKLDAVFMMLYTRKYTPKNEKGLKKVVSKLALALVPKAKYDSLKKKFDLALQKKSAKNKGYRCFSTFRDFDFEPFPNDMFSNLIETEFENCKFLIPSKYKKILDIVYGDYMQLPPIEERVWTHHPILIDFENNFENIKNATCYCNLR